MDFSISFFFSSRRRHTRLQGDWSSDVCSSDLVDGTYDYHDRRLLGAVHLWRSGQQILGVQAYLPLGLALEPVPRRQLPDTLSVGATADSVDLSVLEALTPALQRVTGVFSADLGIAGT